MEYGPLITKALVKYKDMGYLFTHDWFHGGIMHDILQVIQSDKDDVHEILEIGAYEGKSSVWLMETYMKNEESNITIIDPFFETDKTTPVESDTIDRFLYNTKKTGNSDKITFFKDISLNVLPKLVSQRKKYSIIFIDGSHLSRDIIIDITLGWTMLKSDGYMILDDYNNTGSHVKRCIHFWLGCLGDSEFKIKHDRYQLIIQKNNI